MAGRINAGAKNSLKIERKPPSEAPAAPGSGREETAMVKMDWVARIVCSGVPDRPNAR